MKRITLATLATLAVAFTSGTAAQTPPAGPDDHSWTVSLSSYDIGSSPDITTTLTIGAAGGVAAPPDAAPLDGVTTSSDIEPSSRGDVGAQVGSVSYQVQTNIDPALAGSNNVTAGGQPPQCGAPGTIPVGSSFSLYAARREFQTPSVGTVSGGPGQPVPDQQPDLAEGGAPMGVTHVPDWYVPLMNSLGIPEWMVIARAYGIATTANSRTSVNVVTFALITSGWNGLPVAPYKQVMLVGNPVAGFNADGQTVSVCPPFTSTSVRLGTSVAMTWDCSADYFGNPVPGCAGSLVAGPSTMHHISWRAPSFYTGISGAPNADGDVAANGNNLWAQWDNCDVDANPDQADISNNGIGDACKSGGAVWTGSQPAAVANASLSCSTIATSPPWQPCQDADGDMVLNSVDNCPLAANGPGDASNQVDADRDGIGDACDPAPAIPGDGGTLVMLDSDDQCRQPVTIGVGPETPYCVQHEAGSSVEDSNDDGFPTLLVKATSPADCQQDHRADTNGDGYSDSDQGTPFGDPAIAVCPGWSIFPSARTSPRVGTDPLAFCPARLLAAKGGTAAQDRAARRALADINLDGRVDILDLATVSSFGDWYRTDQPPGAQDPASMRTEADLTGDRNINILDLSAVASNFQQEVAACR